MAYRMRGTYVASCDCNQICPCPVDGQPTGPGGECRGVLVVDIREGNLDQTDLAGVKWALYNHFPSNVTSGNWKVGVVVDERASDEQAQALERIVSGQEGGVFGDFVPLVGEYLGMDRASVNLENGRGSIGGVGEFAFEPHKAADGSEVKVRGAMFAFAPEYTIGTTSGRLQLKVGEIESVYGESADFEWASEVASEAPRGRA